MNGLSTVISEAPALPPTPQGIVGGRDPYFSIHKAPEPGTQELEDRTRTVDGMPKIDSPMSNTGPTYPSSVKSSESSKSVALDRWSQRRLQRLNTEQAFREQRLGTGQSAQATPSLGGREPSNASQTQGMAEGAQHIGAPLQASTSPPQAASQGLGNAQQSEAKQQQGGQHQLLQTQQQSSQPYSPPTGPNSNPRTPPSANSASAAGAGGAAITTTAASAAAASSTAGSVGMGIGLGTGMNHQQHHATDPNLAGSGAVSVPVPGPGSAGASAGVGIGTGTAGGAGAGAGAGAAYSLGRDPPLFLQFDPAGTNHTQAPHVPQQPDASAQYQQHQHHHQQHHRFVNHSHSHSTSAHTNHAAHNHSLSNVFSRSLPHELPDDPAPSSMASPAVAPLPAPKPVRNNRHSVHNSVAGIAPPTTVQQPMPTAQQQSQQQQIQQQQQLQAHPPHANDRSIANAGRTTPQPPQSSDDLSPEEVTQLTKDHRELRKSETSPVLPL